MNSQIKAQQRFEQKAIDFFSEIFIDYLLKKEREQKEQQNDKSGSIKQTSNRG